MRSALALALMAACSDAVARGPVPAGWCLTGGDNGTVLACYAGPSGESNCAADMARFAAGECTPYYDDAGTARDGE